MPVVATYIAVASVAWLTVLAGVLIVTTGQWLADAATPKGDR